MQIEKDTVVAIDYTLKNGEGEILDSSTGQAPLTYLHGAGNIIPGLEKELVGRKPGDSLRAIVNPSEGYGDRDEGLVQQINRLQLKDVPQLELGMQLQSQSEQGLQTFTVVKFDEDKVTLDGNHPLAGKMLHFDIEVRSVRFASESEIKHGHVHGPQQHEHSTD